MSKQRPLSQVLTDVVLALRNSAGICQQISFSTGSADAGKEAQQIKLLADEVERLSVPDGLDLAKHIIAMADDAYLVGHPEWHEFVREANALVKKASQEDDGNFTLHPVKAQGGGK